MQNIAFVNFQNSEILNYFQLFWWSKKNSKFNLKLIRSWTWSEVTEHEVDVKFIASLRMVFRGIWKG